MKKIMMVAMTLIVAISSVYAADEFEKAAKKEAKKLIKEGWKVAPGALPLEMQFVESYRKQREKTDDGEDKWTTGDATTIGEYYDGAKMQALTLAINQVAQKIQTIVANAIKTTGGNRQGGGDLQSGEVATALKTATGSTQWVTNTLTGITTVVECYRILPNKNNEVRVIIAYNQKRALNAAKSALRDELIKEGEQLSDAMNNFLLNR